MSDVHCNIDTVTVAAPGPYWHDEFDIIHIVRPLNENFTMCHKWVHVLVLHKVQIMGYVNYGPNCLYCMVIER